MAGIDCLTENGLDATLDGSDIGRGRTIAGTWTSAGARPGPLQDGRRLLRP
jgi:hypothetical protein